MTRKNTFEHFFALMNWEMLKEQKEILKTVRDCIVRSKKRIDTMNRILKLIDYWFSFKDLMRPGSCIKPNDIEWEQLRDDKTEFLYIMELKSITPTQAEAMEGILSGIDTFQDTAELRLGIDKHILFNLSKD